MDVVQHLFDVSCVAANTTISVRRVEFGLIEEVSSILECSIEFLHGRFQCDWASRVLYDVVHMDRLAFESCRRADQLSVESGVSIMIDLYFQFFGRSFDRGGLLINVDPDVSVCL